VADSSVRPARVGDAAELAAVQARAWRASYAELLPPDAYDESAMARSWERAVLVPPSIRHHVLVALDGERAVALAALAPSPDPDVDPATTSELLLIAVDPSERGLGHASRLLAAAVDIWRDEQVTVATCWVPSVDDALRSFLESTGWGPDGAHRRVADPYATADPPATSVEIRQVRLATDLSTD
jgi:GNAT superfamily N-acetyltransferase